MKLPKRPKAHVKETESFRLLQSLAPKEWIVRDVSERDYGNRPLHRASFKRWRTYRSVNVRSTQSRQNIEWEPSDGGHRVARSPSVKTTTATYWLNYSVPVFLFVADLSAKNIYFVAVQEELRTKFDKLDSQNDISFTLSDRLDLKSKRGLAGYSGSTTEKASMSSLSSHITNLINQVEVFGDFIHENQNRDIFLEVEADRHLQFRALHEACRMASLYLEQGWRVDASCQAVQKVIARSGRTTIVICTKRHLTVHCKKSRSISRRSCERQLIWLLIFRRVTGSKKTHFSSIYASAENLIGS